MLTPVAIREASEQDAEAISACLQAAFEPFRCHYAAGAFEDTVLSAEAVRARMSRMVVYVAITADGAVAGTIALSCEAAEGHLRGMAVAPRFQGHAIAKRLLQAAEKHLRAKGCRRVTLDTTSPLQRAIRFYENNGFVATGRIADFFGMPLYEYEKKY